MALEFNLKRLDEVFKSYYTVTNCRVVIFDEEGTMIVSYPEQVCGICKVVRSFEEVDRRCREMDKSAFEKARKSRSICIYECELGLYEAVAPIMQDEKIIGYVMIGQLIDDKNKQRVVEKCLPYFSSRKELEYMIESSESLNFDKLRAGAVLISVCAEYLCLTKDLKRKQKHIFMVIKEYIAQNLGKKITVEMLCKEFGVSRTSLFKLFDDMEGVGVMESVNKMRMEQAREMLAQSDMPISEISEIVGVGDSNYFTRVFKKNSGITPLKYRKEYRVYP